MRHIIPMDHHHYSGSELALGGTMISIFLYVITQIDNIPILTVKIQDIAGIAGAFAGFASATYYIQKFLHERADRRKQKINERKAA